jgi:hypothetical protein
LLFLIALTLCGGIIAAESAGYKPFRPRLIEPTPITHCPTPIAEPWNNLPTYPAVEAVEVHKTNLEAVGEHEYLKRTGALIYNEITFRTRDRSDTVQAYYENALSGLAWRLKEYPTLPAGESRFSWTGEGLPALCTPTPQVGMAVPKTTPTPDCCRSAYLLELTLKEAGGFTEVQIKQAVIPGY